LQRLEQAERGHETLIEPRREPRDQWLLC
jgi:hypothetical protein